MTIIINMRSGVDEVKLRIAAKLIREGKLVAFPTETVYGLGADALNERAVRGYSKPREGQQITH